MGTITCKSYKPYSTCYSHLNLIIHLLGIGYFSCKYFSQCRRLWIAVMLDLTSRRVIIIDPRAHKNYQQQVAEECMCLSYAMPRLLKATSYYNHIEGGEPQEIKDWVVHVIDKSILPTQNDS